METRKKRLYFFSAVLAVAVAGGVYRASVLPSPRRVEARISGWDDRPRMAARLMMERYGRPDRLAPDSVTWIDRAPWKRIVVRNGAPAGFVEQTVGYSVPFSRVAPMREFGHGVRVDVAAEEMTAAGDEEGINRLALNLAHEVATGKRSAAEASAFYGKTATLSFAGKRSAYMTDLLFRPFVPEPGNKRRRGFGY